MGCIIHTVTVIAAYEQHNIKAQYAADDEYSYVYVSVYELVRYTRGFAFGILHITIFLLYVIIKRIITNQLSFRGSCMLFLQ